MGALLFLRTKKVHRIASPRGILRVNNNTACRVSRLCDCLHSGASIRHCLMFIDTVTGGGFVLEGREEEEICMHNLTVGAASKQGAGEHTQRAHSVSVHSRCGDAANSVHESKHLRLSTARLSTFSFIFNFLNQEDRQGSHQCVAFVQVVGAARILTIRGWQINLNQSIISTNTNIAIVFRSILNLCQLSQLAFV